MKCPKCEQEMECGGITAGGYRIIWTGKKLRWTNFIYAGDVLLQSPGASGKVPPAFICRSCRMVVLDY